MSVVEPLAEFGTIDGCKAAKKRTFALSSCGLGRATVDRPFATAGCGFSNQAFGLRLAGRIGNGGLEGRENSLAVGALDDAEPHQGFTRDDETKDVGVERWESSRRFTRRVALEPHYAPDLVHAKRQCRFFRRIEAARDGEGARGRILASRLELQCGELAAVAHETGECGGDSKAKRPVVTNARREFGTDHACVDRIDRASCKHEACFEEAVRPRPEPPFVSRKSLDHRGPARHGGHEVRFEKLARSHGHPQLLDGGPVTKEHADGILRREDRAQTPVGGMRDKTVVRIRVRERHKPSDRVGRVPRDGALPLLGACGGAREESCFCGLHGRLERGRTQGWMRGEMGETGSQCAGLFV